MSQRKPTPLPESSRFQGKIRHYHQANRKDEVSWDEWSGDKIKGAKRGKLERMMLSFSTIVVGLVLLSGAIYVIFFVLKKILPLLSK